MNELREIRRAARLTAEDVVNILREKYPKIDKTCISKAESGLYGIELSRGAMHLLRMKVFGTQNREEKRIKRHCVSVRLTDEEFCRLQRHLKRREQTAQEFFAGAVPKGDI